MAKDKNSKKKKRKKEGGKKQKSKSYKKEIHFKIAKKIDFLQVVRYEKNRKVWDIVKGRPYWCLNSKGEIENRNYILDEHTDLEDFTILLMNEQILIPKHNVGN